MSLEVKDKRKAKDFQYLREPINVKCKIVNVIEVWKVWLI